jgi:hypothetical protein
MNDSKNDSNALVAIYAGIAMQALLSADKGRYINDTESLAKLAVAVAVDLENEVQCHTEGLD